MKTFEAKNRAEWRTWLAAKHDKEVVVWLVHYRKNTGNTSVEDGTPFALFKTEGEIENYLEFVEFTVNYSKDRVRFFEKWNEPDIRRLCCKYIAQLTT